MFRERKSRRVIGAVTISAAGATIAGVFLIASGLAAQTPSGELEGGSSVIAAAEDMDFVEVVSERTLSLDASSSPRQAQQFLEENADQLEGWTVTVEGIEVLSGQERREADEVLGVDDANVESIPCVSAPTGARSKDGSTIAHPGCLLEADSASRSSVHRGQTENSTEAAVAEVVASALGVSNPTIEVHLDRRSQHLDISLSSELTASRAVLPVAEGIDLDHRIMMTVYSNGNVSSFSASIDGDCLAYALFVGGDSCARVALSETEGVRNG